MLIKYDIAGYQTLLFYGTGKVVRHIYVSLPNSTNRTCTGEVEQAEINKLLKALVKQRFFDMPLRRYAISSRSLDELRELKLHSIMIDDGTTRSSRQFAAGTYQGHQERIPKKFAAVEAALQNLGDAALAGAECNQASPSIVREIELPTIHADRVLLPTHFKHRHGCDTRFPNPVASRRSTGHTTLLLRISRTQGFKPQ